MLHRRRFLSAVALTPVVASVAPVATARGDDALGGGAARVAPSGSPAGGSPARVAPGRAGALAADLELAGGFRVVRAFDVHHGALPFVIEGEGERFQVDVLRRDPTGPAGVFETEALSLFVHDPEASRGLGGTFTSPPRVRGARALGAALQRRLDAGVALPAIVSFVERRAQHPRAAFDVDFDAPSADPALRA